jgi:hypothetical protein
MSEIGTAAIRRAAIKYGGAVQVDGQTLYVDAPRGSIWKATETHAIIRAIEPHDKKLRAAELATIEADINQGLERCAEQDCEHCESQGAGD